MLQVVTVFFYGNPSVLILAHCTVQQQVCGRKHNVCDITHTLNDYRKSLFVYLKVFFYKPAQILKLKAQ